MGGGKKRRRSAEGHEASSSTAAPPPPLQQAQRQQQQQEGYLMPLTKYERVRLIGSRANRLASGAARPLVQLPGNLDPLVLAQEEFRLGLLRSVVVRTAPDGERQCCDCSKLKPPLLPVV
jgi:DNA-directed RNA polymerase subunit K/omega